MKMEKRSNKEAKNPNKQRANADKKNQDHRSTKKGQKRYEQSGENLTGSKEEKERKIDIDDNPGDTLRKKPRMDKPE